jgi:hypothetical protein
MDALAVDKASAKGVMLACEGSVVICQMEER